VHWGGNGWDALGLVDEMHFELLTGLSIGKLKEVADRIRAGKVGVTTPTPAPATPWYRGALGSRTLQNGSQGSDVTALQAIMNRRYPAYSHIVVDGVFGDQTDAVMRDFQKRAKLAVDGIIGPNTFKALGVRP
jgi:peptidoglycan hydrolase-like protein with peptidoglycan-binding domain